MKVATIGTGRHALTSSNRGIWYNYSDLDQLRISSVNSTRRVLQKILLHHRSIFSASSKNTLKYRSHCYYSDHRKHCIINKKRAIAKRQSRELKCKVSK